MTDQIYVCPECDSDRVTTEHIQTFVNNRQLKQTAFDATH